MIASSHRLEQVAVQLIERLEGTRRSYRDRPEELDVAAVGLCDEVMAPILDEYRELMGDDQHPDWLRREVRETFLPRYLALARDQNEIEARGYNTRMGRDPMMRIAALIVGVVVASALWRVLPGIVGMLTWVAAFALPLLPELRGISYKRHYQGELQSLIDDLGRIQKQVESYAPSLPAGELDGPQATRRRLPPQAEKH